LPACLASDPSYQAAKKLLGDRAYDSAPPREWARRARNRSRRAQQVDPAEVLPLDKRAYKLRHRIENAFCRLKDFRRIATRYDRLARNFFASICRVAAVVWWAL
jgi:transposase